jgi:hypothetical protein
MQIIDGRGKQVNVGLTVRYGGTGTTGEVSAVKVEEDEGWVQIDHSEMWYNSESLEVRAENNIKPKKNSSKEFNDLRIKTIWPTYPWALGPVMVVDD